MSLTYTYFKMRKGFGRQPMFCMVKPEMVDNIMPDEAEQKKYCLRNPVNQESQAVLSQSQQEINTTRVVLTDTGINHLEGGWPKDIHFDDEETTSRYRRRIERDESYVDAIMHLTPKFEHYIDQNNAINMYDLFYKNMPSEDPVEKPIIRINNVFRDRQCRPTSSIGWTCEEDSKLVVSYCDKVFPINTPSRNTDLVGYLWNVELPSSPVDEFLPPVACWQVVCSPVSAPILLGGLEDGRVCIFDLRSGNSPQDISPEHIAHRDPVSALLYINSRLNNEFFSASTDGVCMWWDVRNISKPTEAMIMSVFSPIVNEYDLANAQPITTLQFDKAFPTRFLCGTDTGLVVNVNRKGKSHNEVMSAVFKAHYGPVKALHRNPSISKMFITCGDWRVNVWSDEIISTPIIPGQPQKYQINDVIWAPHRASSYMSVSADGRLRYWDFLRKYREPIVISRLSQHPLLKIKAHDNGQMIAVGDKKGVMYLVQLSDILVYSGNKDKPRMIQTYERETRREHLLETKIKEIRLKLTKTEDVGVEAPPIDEITEDFTSVESEYKRIVDEEVRNMGPGRTLSSSQLEKVKQEVRKR
ncbi:dynein intermediate chain 3, ciliary-like [Plodia interpunctella]|uniref:dynein intermediate chain 3, ciliary-like n=1 Tax=Plodia interpunctella TaxID=58824 RepID=UPI002367FF79|nr:dynein intermediate chain 3, ciliary-like [Plodia interpunctella]